MLQIVRSIQIKMQIGKDESLYLFILCCSVMGKIRGSSKGGPTSSATNIVNSKKLKAILETKYHCILSKVGNTQY